MDALFRRLYEARNSQAAPDVIVNLQAVTYLNSSNHAQLIRLRKKVLSCHRRLRI